MSNRPWWDLKPHGTPAAARRHYRHGEKLCESCRQAEQRRHEDSDGTAAYNALRSRRHAYARAAGASYAEARAARTDAGWQRFTERRAA